MEVFFIAACSINQLALCIGNHTCVKINYVRIICVPLNGLKQISILHIPFAAHFTFQYISSISRAECRQIFTAVRFPIVIGIFAHFYWRVRVFQ